MSDYYDIEPEIRVTRIYRDGSWMETTKAGMRRRVSFPDEPETTAERVPPKTIQQIALDTLREMRQSGESHEMCARWLSERLGRLLSETWNIQREALNEERRTRQEAYAELGRLAKENTELRKEIERQTVMNDELCRRNIAFDREAQHTREENTKLRTALEENVVTLDESGRNRVWSCELCGCTTRMARSYEFPTRINHESTCLLAQPEVQS
jgi:hypothetical protein